MIFRFDFLLGGFLFSLHAFFEAFPKRLVVALMKFLEKSINISDVPFNLIRVWILNFHRMLYHQAYKKTELLNTKFVPPIDVDYLVYWDEVVSEQQKGQYVNKPRPSMLSPRYF